MSKFRCSIIERMKSITVLLHGVGVGLFVQYLLSISETCLNAMLQELPLLYFCLILSQRTPYFIAWLLFLCGPYNVSFFLKRFIAQKISEIHRVTKLRNCSFNQFALVVPRRASDRECTVSASYEYSSEKQVQRKNTAAVG